MPESVTRVSYQAIADFTSLHIAANEAVADLDRIKAKEAELNAASAAQMDGAKAASVARQKAMQDEAAAMNVESAAAKVHEAATKADTVAENASTDAKKVAAAAAKDATKAIDDESESKKKNSSITKDLASDVGSLGKAILAGVGHLLRNRDALDSNTRSTSSFRESWGRLMADVQTGTDRTLVAAGNGFDKLGTQLQKFLSTGNGAGGVLPITILAPLIAGILAVVGPAVAGVSALGAAVLGLAANLGTLSGLLLAAPAIVTAYATSIGILQEAFKGVGTALSAWQAVQNGTGTLKAYDQALAKLTPSQRDFVKWLESMSGAWINFKNVVTGNFFAQFQGDLDKLGPTFGVITSMMGAAATAVGQVVDGFIKFASSPGFKIFLNGFSEQNAATIGTIGHVLMDVLDILMKITTDAAPLVKDLDSSFASMADHLDAIVTKASNDGSLVKWLGDVYNNLHLWWGIVSDLAKTILNYGSAAQNFGTWITQGLKDVTDGWLAASEAAMKPGSSFQEWLGNIKPLVTELARTIGDLLHWWNQTSASQNNITKMLTMLRDINNNLGPALGNLLDTMAKTNVGPALISLITNLVKLVDTILANGGAQAIEGVINFLAGAAQFASQLAAIPGVAPALVTIAAAFGTLAAISLANKFVPILDLVAALLRLVDAEGPITRVLNGLTGFKSPKVAKTAAEGGAGTTVISEGKAAEGSGAGAAGAAGKSGGFWSGIGNMFKGRAGSIGTGLGIGILGDQLANSLPQGNDKKNGLNWNNLDNGIRGVSQGANIGSLFGWGGMLAGGAIGAVTSADWGGAGQHGLQQIGGALKGAEDGVGSIRVGSSTLGQGAASMQKAVGGVLDGKNWDNGRQQADKAISGIFDSKNWANGGKQIEDFFTKTIPTAVKGAGKGLGDFFKPLTDSFKNGGNQIETFFTKTIPGWIKDAGKNLSDFFKPLTDGFKNGSKQIETFFTKTIPDTIGKLGKSIGKIFDGKTWMNGLKEFGDFFTKVLPYDLGDFVGRVGRFFTKDLPSFVKDAGKNLTNFFKPLTDGLKNGGKQIETFFTKTIPGWFKNSGKDAGNFFKPLTDGLKNGGKQIETFFTKTLPNFAKDAGKNIWNGLQDAGKWLGAQSGKFLKWIGTDVPAFFMKAGPVIWGGLQDAGKWLGDQASKFVKWLTSDVPGFFARAGAAVWAALQTADKWLNDQATKFWNWLLSIPGFFARAGAAIWAALQTADKWLNDQATKFWNWLVGLPGMIAKGAGDLWNSLPSIGGWIADQARAVANFVGGIASQISHAFDSGVKNGTQGKHSGGTIYRAGGGSVPGAGDYDSVHAMLTPGEVVIRKSIVDAVGEQNLLALNDGLMSYQQLLTRAMTQDPGSKIKTPPSFLSGVGLAGVASLSSLPANSSAVQYANSSSGAASRGSGMHIENLNVINPTPERASDSLPRTIRKVGYLNLARGR